MNPSDATILTSAELRELFVVCAHLVSFDALRLKPREKQFLLMLAGDSFAQGRDWGAVGLAQPVKGRRQPGRWLTQLNEWRPCEIFEMLENWRRAGWVVLDEAEGFRLLPDRLPGWADAFQMWQDAQREMQPLGLTTDHDLNKELARLSLATATAGASNLAKFSLGSRVEPENQAKISLGSRDQAKISLGSKPSQNPMESGQWGANANLAKFSLGGFGGSLSSEVPLFEISKLKVLSSEYPGSLGTEGQISKLKNSRSFADETQLSGRARALAEETATRKAVAIATGYRLDGYLLEKMQRHRRLFEELLAGQTPTARKFAVLYASRPEAARELLGRAVQALPGQPCHPAAYLNVRLSAEGVRY